MANYILRDEKGVAKARLTGDAANSVFRNVTVVSNDYDFIDIFKMAVMINEHASEVTFRMVVPFAQGRMAELPPKSPTSRL